MKIDWDKLRAELDPDIIQDGEERYQFTWPDKRAASRLANETTNMTLRPCREESVGKDGTPGGFDSENLYIEGDNLDVLKVLRETYLGRVKMIYIDPPYNTGNDFVYNDDFSIRNEELGMRSGWFDDEGNQLIDPMQRNTEANGRFHTDWLNMIYPRLKVARDLLSQDGVIFISIDRNEFINLAKICDDVFGPSNRIGLISTINNLKGRSDDAFFATCNEFVVVYAKNYNMLKLNGFLLEDEELDSDYEKQDEIGFYKLIGLRKTGNNWRREDRPYMFYPILYKNNEFFTISKFELNKLYDPKTQAFNDVALKEISEKYKNQGYNVIWPKTEDSEYGRWRWGVDTFLQNKDVNIELNSAGTVCSKMRATLEDGSIRVKSAKTVWYKPEYDTGSSSKLLLKLFGKKDIFDNPKSIIYITDILRVGSNKDAIILDFFSGSATTAHAVMKLNAEDGGHRKFIMVQLPEITDEKSEARKAGYETICEIGKERIRRAGERIRNEGLRMRNEELGIRNNSADTDNSSFLIPNSSLDTPNSSLDIGFRVLKLDSSNMEEVFYTPDAFDPSQLDGLVDNIKADRTPEDLLFQVMLDLGIELSASIRNEELGGRNCFIVDDGNLIACFDKDVNETTIEEMAKLLPTHLVIRDASAANDNVLDNFDQIIESYSNEKKITTHVL